MQFQSEAFKVAEHFVCSIINGDDTGLEDGEVHLLEDFIEDVTRDRELGHFSIEPQESEFALCEICGLQAMCVTLIYYYRELAPGQFDA